MGGGGEGGWCVFADRSGSRLVPGSFTSGPLTVRGAACTAEGSEATQGGLSGGQLHPSGGGALIRLSQVGGPSAEPEQLNCTKINCVLNLQEAATEHLEEDQKC